jgi:phosphatidylglycerol lysyltransferase
MAAAWARRLGPLVGVTLFALAAAVLYRISRGTDLDAARAAVLAIAPARLAAAAGLTAVAYLSLTLIDLLACRHAGHPLAWRRVAIGSFIGHAFTHTLGNALLVGGSVRYRLYSAWGLSTAQVATVVTFCFIGFWVGFPALAGTVLVADPPPAAALHVPGGSARAFGGLLLVAPAAWLAASALLRRPLAWGRLRVALPPLRFTLPQVALGSTEMALRALVLWTLAPGLAIGFAGFLGAYLLAMAAGKLSQVPGGLGVLEGTFVLLVPSAATPAGLGALAAYRGIYYLAPLVGAAVALGGVELALRRERFRSAFAGLAGWLGLAVRHIMAACAVLAGAVLAIGAVLPPLPDRGPLAPGLEELTRPLCAALGVLLLVAGRGLQRKLRRAWHLALASMGAGAGCATLGSAAWEEAAALLLLGAALLPCREDFHRGARLRDLEFIPGWIACFTLVLLLMVAAAVFAHPHAAWSPRLWWAAGDEDATALRALSAAAAAMLVVAASRVLRAAAPLPPPPNTVELERAGRIARAAPATLGLLALLGDKQLLFSDRGDAFLMYRIEGRSWVALGDPVGAPGQLLELAWRFRDLCDHHDGRPAFFQVRDPAPYADLGLAPVAIGEEASVDLAAAPRSAPSPADLGCDFAVEPRERTLALLPELKAIADRWAALHGGSFDGFAHGHFDPTWLSRFPVATLRRRADGRLLAFAELWRAGARAELSLDFLRFAPEAPDGTLDALFAATMAWGRAEGWARFSFGLLPLREAPPLEAAAERLGRRVYAHGEHFPGRVALRAFAARFDPQWRTRWLCSRPELHVPRVVHDIIALAAPGARPSAALELV